MSITQVSAADTAKYVVGDFLLITSYNWEDEVIQNAILSLPEHTSSLLFSSVSKETQSVQNTYWVTLKDATKHTEAYKVLRDAGEIWVISFNYIYELAGDTVAIESTYHKGDLDKDGSISTKDYLRIKKAFLKEHILSDAEKNLADINNNGSIDSTDYLNIKSHFLGQISITADGWYNGMDLSVFNSVPDENTLLQIKKDFIKTTYEPSLYTEEDVTARMFIGPFDGTYVMMISTNDAAFPTVETIENVGGVSFKYRDAQKLKVWKDGSFYSLSEAFENNILSKEHIDIVSKIYLNKKSNA